MTSRRHLLAIRISILFWTLSAITLEAQNWVTPVTIVPNLSPGDYGFHVTRTTRTHIVFRNNTGDGRIYYLSMDSAAATSPVRVAYGPAILSNPSLALSSSDSIALVYTASISTEPPNISVIYSNQGTWSSHRALTATTDILLFPRAYFDESDTLRLAWLIGDNNNLGTSPGDIYFGTVDGYALKDSVRISYHNRGGQSISMVSDDSGGLHLIWESLDSLYSLGVQRHATRRNGRWSPPIDIGNGQLTQVATDSNHDLHMVYLGLPGMGGTDIFYRQFSNATWLPPIRLSRNRGIADQGKYSHTMAFLNQNRIAVAWLEGSQIFSSIFFDGRWSPPRWISDGAGGTLRLAFDKTRNYLQAFWLLNPNLSITHSPVDTVAPIFYRPPNLRDSIEAGGFDTLRWSAYDNEGVFDTEILFSSDNGLSWDSLVVLDHNDSLIVVNFPKLFSDSCQIRVRVFDYWMNRAEALSNRFVLRNIPPRTFTLVTPPVGATLHRSQESLYRWHRAHDALRDTITYALKLFRVSPYADSASVIQSFPAGADTFLLRPPSNWWGVDTSFSWTVWAFDGIDSTSSSGSPRSLFVTPLPTSVEASELVTKGEDTFRAYPNPFNSSTKIRFELAEPSSVSIQIFDVLGRLVADLVSDEFAPGAHDVTWAPSASSGVYYCRFAVQGKLRTVRIMLLR